jgi:DNA-binding Xre family transcriptional regulator
MEVWGKGKTAQSSCRTHGTPKRTAYQEQNYAYHRRHPLCDNFLVSAHIRVHVMFALAYYDGMAIYLRLREFRRALGLTQSELAARAGIRRATVSRLENSRITSIDLSVLEKLANLLRVEPGFLLSRTPPT